MRCPTVSSRNADSSSSRTNLFRSSPRSSSICSVLGQEAALFLSNFFIVQLSPQTLIRLVSEATVDEHRRSHGDCRCPRAITRDESAVVQFANSNSREAITPEPTHIIPYRSAVKLCGFPPILHTRLQRQALARRRRSSVVHGFCKPQVVWTDRQGIHSPSGCPVSCCGRMRDYTQVFHTPV